MIATVRVVELDAKGVEGAGSSWSSFATDSDGVNGGDEPDITERQEIFDRKQNEGR
jgi:hypothetical protein